MSIAIERVNGHTPETSHAESWARPGIVDAEAEAIRARTAADVEARRIEAEATAEAIKIKAAEEAEKTRIANERAVMRLERERADNEAKIAEAKRRKEAAERAATAEREAAEAATQEQVAAEEAVESATGRWRKTAKGFYALCATVALPVQMAAFYDPNAKYLLVAPIFIEVIALVALVGAAAAVTAHRPHWHYRLVAWAGAVTAATISIFHGLEAFDAATAFGSALASVAGPGMWDLHEHGRIARRDGTLTRRERRAQRKADRKAAQEKTAREAEQRAAKEAADAAAQDAAGKLAKDREQTFPEVWKHALKLAAALGETAVTEAIWKRAHRDVEGADPAESAAILNMRKNAERRVEAARSGVPVNRSNKAMNAQAASQMPASPSKRVYNPPARPGRRTKGDTPKYVTAARRQASITARAAATEESK
ncbi:hypothetical protein [Streptomyces scopuliridis]|uniref:hypothetical protein n=1 Tax=Streptomyces scopuliridis TaxID=452529 RepID=UPI00369BB65C